LIIVGGEEIGNLLQAVTIAPQRIVKLVIAKQQGRKLMVKDGPAGVWMVQ
jgi:hypothetical protein